jgi:hypothetical protein
MITMTTWLVKLFSATGLGQSLLGQCSLASGTIPTATIKRFIFTGNFMIAHMPWTHCFI